jgi:prevent-host-death family protein
MKTTAIADAARRLTDFVDDCREDPVILTKRGRPAAALVAVPADGDELERFILAHTPRFQRVLRRSQRSIEAGKGLTEAELWQAVDASVRPVKKRRRAARRHTW